MNILFGMEFDGSVWSPKDESLGEIRTGPMGMLSILETQLGLSMPVIHPAQRIEEYRQRLEALDDDSWWFHASFSADPWSTAQQLLKWRDELVEAGWRGETKGEGSARLNTLNSLEQIESILSPGWADRIRHVMESLKQKKTVQIESISLVEDISLYPIVWQSILDQLKSQGTILSQWKNQPRQSSDNNLSRVQGSIENNDVPPAFITNDDSLIMMKAENEWEAAEHLAIWLSSDPDANSEVTIICGMQTDILDQALSRHGLPRIGHSTHSRWSELNQVLPLMIANAWKPVDIYSMAELLTLGSAPFPGWVRKELLNAISQEPGVCGPQWNNALTRIGEKKKTDLQIRGDENADVNSRKFVQEIQSFLVEDRFDPESGIPEDHLRKICRKVVNWFSARMESDPAVQEIVSQCKVLQELTFGKGSIPRITLERMLDSVTGTEKYSLNDLPEAAPWHVVDHPGQIVDPCDTIIWWGFQDSTNPVRTYWSNHEREALGSLGVQLEEPKTSRIREIYDWHQGFQNAGKHFIAYYSVRLDGEEAYHHPFWEFIMSHANLNGNPAPQKKLEHYLIRGCKEYLDQKNGVFAGRRYKQEEVHPVLQPSQGADFVIPPSTVKPIKSLSYSQMNTMIACPMKWALEYYAGLRIPDYQSIPAGNQMLGTFCHRIVERLYSENRGIDERDAKSKAGLIYDELLPSLASELLLPGNALERQRYRFAITEAIVHLVSAVNRLHLTVEETEARLEGMIGDTPFHGFVDLILKDPEGHPFVLDLKWTGSSEYHRKEVEEGSCLQLAAYAWMLKAKEPSVPIQTGYFMLAQGELISDSKLLNEQAVSAPFSMDEVWNRGITSMREVTSRMNTGVLEARGVNELLISQNEKLSLEKYREQLTSQYMSKGMMYRNPPCGLCDFKLLCGYTGVQFE